MFRTFLAALAVLVLCAESAAARPDRVPTDGTTPAITVDVPEGWSSQHRQGADDAESTVMFAEPNAAGMIAASVFNIAGTPAALDQIAQNFADGLGTQLTGQAEAAMLDGRPGRAYSMVMRTSSGTHPANVRLVIAPIGPQRTGAVATAIAFDATPERAEAVRRISAAIRVVGPGVPAR
jgi:hypothetical protein